jgi:hypothetical protein
MINILFLLAAIILFILVALLDHPDSWMLPIGLASFAAAHLPLDNYVHRTNP